MGTSQFQKSKKDLNQDYQKMLKDTKALLASLPEEMDSKSQEALEQLQETVVDLKKQYGAVEEKVQDQLQQSDQLIRDYPYQSAGVSLVFGFLAGLLFRRNSR